MHTYLISSILSLAIFGLGFTMAQQPNTLQMVHVIMRHGERNPPYFPSSDPANRPDSWAQGPGELTDLGIMQNYFLGNWLKIRYSGFVSNDYQQKEIYSRADGAANRTLMAAEAAMSGFYDNYQFGQNQSMSYPVPIHSFDVDPALGGAPCALANLLAIRVLLSSENWKYLIENQNFISYVADRVGTHNLEDNRDQLETEYRHLGDHLPPPWDTPIVRNKIDELSGKFLSFFNVSSPDGKPSGGLLYKEITDRMQQKANEDWRTLSPDLKFILYGTHDVHIMEVLRDMGACDEIWPPYASALIFELHKNGNNYSVQIHYQNFTDNSDPTAQLAPPVPIRIPKCSAMACPLQEFITLATPHFPKDWQADCNFDIMRHANSFYMQKDIEGANWKNIAYLFILLTVVLAFAVCLLAVALIRERRRNKNGCTLQDQDRLISNDQVKTNYYSVQ